MSPNASPSCKYVLYRQIFRGFASNPLGAQNAPDPQLTIADTKVSVQHMTRKMSQTNVLPWGGGVDGLPHSAHGGGGASPIAGDFLWGVKKFRQGG